MGFRFSRRFKILPGLRLNLSRSGVSTSVGTRGAWLTFGKSGTRATVGLPGTGVSYTTNSPHETPSPEPPRLESPSGGDPSNRPPGDSKRKTSRALLWLLLLVAAAVILDWRSLS